MEAICEMLLLNGWITEFFFHDSKGTFGVKWTAKGMERARWVNEIGDELNLGPMGLAALLTICKQHGQKS